MYVCVFVCLPVYKTIIYTKYMKNLKYSINITNTKNLWTMETKLLLEGYKTITSPIKIKAWPLPGSRQMQHWVENKGTK